MTSNVTTIHPFQALLPATTMDLDEDPKALTEQLRSVAAQRVVRRTPDALLWTRRPIDSSPGGGQSFATMVNAVGFPGGGVPPLELELGRERRAISRQCRRARKLLATKPPKLSR